jgi:hypothetical protein
MGDPFQQFSAGDDITNVSAAFLNDLQAMLAEWKKARSSKGSSLSTLPPNPSVVRIQNNGSDVDRFGVLGIDYRLSTIPIDPNNSVPGFQSTVLSGFSPDQTQHHLGFAVTLEPIPSATMGRAAVSGIVPVQVQANQFTAGILAADVLQGDNTQLQLTSGGFRVLWIEEYDATTAAPGQQNDAGAGSPQNQTLWAYVQLGLAEGIVSGTLTAGQPDTSHPQGSYRKYNISSGPYQAQPTTISVLNEIKTVANASGKTAYIQGFGGIARLLEIDPCSS